MSPRTSWVKYTKGLPHDDVVGTMKKYEISASYCLAATLLSYVTND